jgi:hypothetical protein
MKAAAPAAAGALMAACIAACSSHVDVGSSTDGASAPSRPDASEGGTRSDAGVSHSAPLSQGPIGTLTQF